MQQYISGNPYDLGRIVTTLLGDFAAGNQAGANAGRSILESMAVRSSVVAVLDAMLAGELVLDHGDARHYLTPDADSAAAIPVIEAELARATAWGQRALGLAPPPMLVRVVREFAAPTCVAFDTPGMVLLQLPSTLIDSPELNRLLWHELGHCLLRCGVRFLDEGWATWVEYQRHGDDGDGASHAALLAAAKAAPVGGQYTLSELLATGFTNTLGFEDQVRNDAERDGLYPKGAAAIAALVQRCGTAGVAALFHSIKVAPDQALRLFQDMLGQPGFSALDTQLFARAAPAAPVAPHLERAAVLTARAACDGMALHAIATELYAQHSGGNASPALSTTLLDAYVSARELGHPFTPSQVKLADQLAAAMLRRPPQLSLLELGARHALINLIDAQNFFDRATLAAKAQKLVQSACALQADAPDALLTRAHLMIHTPLQYGGDPDAGRALLRKVGQRADHYGPIAISIYRKQFGEPSPAPVALATVPLEVSSDAPLVFVLCDLRFGQGKDFSMELDQLELRAGEVVGVIGPNGAGKSLLLECCVGLQQFAASVHQLFGQDYRQWHRQLSQRPRLGAKLHRLGFSPSYLVADIVSLARASFGADDADSYSSFAIEPLLRKKYGWLSTGQRQRVDLYFAFHRTAELLVLDEPTLGLDEDFTSRLLQLMARKTAAGAAILVVSHQRQILGLCHRIAVLAGGRVQTSGSPQALSERYLSAYRIDLDHEAEAARSAVTTALRALAPHTLVERQQGLTAMGDQAFLERFQAAATRLQWHHYQVRACELSDLYAVAASLAQPDGGSV